MEPFTWWEALDERNHRMCARLGRPGYYLMHGRWSPLRWLCNYRDLRYGVPHDQIWRP